MRLARIRVYTKLLVYALLLAGLWSSVGGLTTYRRLISLSTLRWDAVQTLFDIRQATAYTTDSWVDEIDKLSFHVLFLSTQESNILNRLQAFTVHPLCHALCHSLVSENSVQLFAPKHPDWVGGSTGRGRARTERIRLKPDRRLARGSNHAQQGESYVLEL